ncbi:mitochondrial carrier protein / MCP6 [Leishmania donovani]|nr:mitochondrial carrier protein / MCP6 [Leishmania donovani]
MNGSGAERRRTTSPLAPSVDSAAKEPPEVSDGTAQSGNVSGSLIETSSLSASSSPKETAAPDAEDDEFSVTKSLHLRRDWYSSIATFIAGGVAGAASRTLTAPLDRIKLIAQEGHLVQAPKPVSATAAASCAASFGSAAASVASKTQTVRQQHPSLLQVARMIKADGGWKAFWRGNTINCFKAGPEFAIVFSIRRYLSSLYEDCVEREKARKKILLARWKAMDERSASICCRTQETREFMRVGTEEPRARTGATGLQSIVDGTRSSYRAGHPTLVSPVSPAASVTPMLTSDEVRQRERAISVEASILTPPFHRLGCISTVPQLAVNCTIGALAGLGAQGILYPLEVVKTRVVVSRSHEYKGGVVEIARVAYHKGGVMEFYRGFVPNMVGIVVYRGLEMGLYSSAQQSIMMYRMQVKKMKRHEASLNSAEVGVVGMFSSTVAQTVSYPLNVIRTRLQTQGTNGRAKKYSGMVDCMVKMIRNKGVTSLFSGLTANYLKAVPASACTFVVFEWAQRLLVDDD